MHNVELGTKPSTKDMNEDVRLRDNRRYQSPDSKPVKREAAGENQKLAPDDDSEDNPKLWSFHVLYSIAQLIGITVIILLVFWVCYYSGGFGWNNPSLQFNWHPLLMNLGMIYIYSNSILIFRVFRETGKRTLKLYHALLNALALIVAIIGVTVAFDGHNLMKPPIPNLYSLHSWVGLSVVILFAWQWVSGFVLFLLPGIRLKYKREFMPYHVYFGYCGFILSIANSLIGLPTEAIISLSLRGYSESPTAATILNSIGVLNIIFGALVVYLATKPEYGRVPPPKEPIGNSG